MKPRLDWVDVSKWFPKSKDAFKKLVFTDNFTRNSWFNEKVRQGNVYSYLLPMGYVALVIRVFNIRDDVGHSMDRTRFCTRSPESIVSFFFSFPSYILTSLPIDRSSFSGATVQL